MKRTVSSAVDVRNSSNGAVRYPGYNGYVWSGTPYSAPGTRYLDVGYNGLLVQSPTYRAYGMPVRCVRG